jgi:transposase
MDTSSLFTAALQLCDPWEVAGVELRGDDPKTMELHVTIAFGAGARFPCPEGECAQTACPVHDTAGRTWRHLDFFQYRAYIHAAHGGNPGKVGLAACDMSLGFAKGIGEHLPNAGKVIDKFHVVRHANEAVDKVRKQEARANGLPRRTKYIWLRNEQGPGDRQLETKRSLGRQRLKTARACRMRESLQDIYRTSASPAEAWVSLHRLCSWMMHSRLEPMKEFAGMTRRHFDDILAYFEHPYTNAILEGLNSIIQNAERRARGFRNMDYFTTMIYLNCGKLDLEAVIRN